MHDVLVSLSSDAVTGASGPRPGTYNVAAGNLKTFIQDAGYNGKTLIGDIAGSSGSFGRVATVRNDAGALYGLATFGGKALYNAIAFAFDAGSPATSGTAYVAGHGTHIGTGPTVAALATSTLRCPRHYPKHEQCCWNTCPDFRRRSIGQQMNAVGQALNTVGSEVNYVKNQITYNNDKIDALNTGLGALVDADLAKELAQLQALQIRQQLGTQALSLANQAPQTLLSLFK